MKCYNFLIKPASGLCNMKCKYCFYEDEVSHRTIKNSKIMSYETAQSIVKRAFEQAQKNDIITFAFQGGEPTLAGKDFFINFTNYVKKNNKNNLKINYTIQTNGLIIDQDWINIFKENNFLVGVSIDGDKDIHDLNRVDLNNKGTWNKVTKCLKMLIKENVDVNVLCVVTRSCARKPQKIYNSLKKLDIKYIQTIACLDPIEKKRGSMPYSLLPEDYGKFLCNLFDIWYSDFKNNQYISIRIFEDFVHLALGLPPTTCATSGFCGAYYVIESDGSVYPCDFYALDEWKIGNIKQNSIQELSNCEKTLKFLKEGFQKPLNCSACKWKYLCNGGCKRDWFISNDCIQNYFCPSFKMLFNHAENKIFEIAKTIH